MGCLIVQWTQRIDSSLRSMINKHYCCIHTYWDQFQPLASKNVVMTRLPPPDNRGRASETWYA